MEGFRAGRDTSLPKRGPDAGTMGLVRPRSGSMISITRTVDWPTDPPHTPSGGGLRADPVQKHDPGERMLDKLRVDRLGPVTEARMSAVRGTYVPVARRRRDIRE